METIENWDLALLVIVGYVAVVTLVRLMARHRNQLVERFRQDLEREKSQGEVRDSDRRRQRRAG